MRGKAPGDETFLDFPFDAEIKRARFRIGANGRIKRKSPRAVLVQEAGYGQRIVDIDLTESVVRACLTHGCAQRANASIHLPPGSIGRQCVEVDNVVFQAWAWGQRLAGQRN